MNAILLVVSIILYLMGYSILRNEFCKNVMNGKADLHAYNALNSVVSAITLVIVAAFSGGLCVPSAYTLGLGVLFGLATGFCAILGMAALERGPLSYTNLIISCSMVVPALSGLVLYGEPVSAWQYMGIGLMLVSFSCALEKNDLSTGMSPKWMLTCLGAFLCSGAVGVMQKLHQNSPSKSELGMFLVIAFLVSSILSLGMTFYYKTSEPITVLQKSKRTKFLVYSIGSGIGIALVNQINLYLAGVMAAIILYPVINGASMILSTAAGVLLWKERLSKKQWFGIVTGGAAILLLCNIL